MTREEWKDVAAMKQTKEEVHDMFKRWGRTGKPSRRLNYTDWDKFCDDMFVAANKDKLKPIPVSETDSYEQRTIK